MCALQDPSASGTFAFDEIVYAAPALITALTGDSGSDLDSDLDSDFKRACVAQRIADNGVNRARAQ